MSHCYQSPIGPPEQKNVLPVISHEILCFSRYASTYRKPVQSKNIIRTLQLKEERANAQLVVQKAHLNKLNQVLHTKENKKKSDHTILFAEGFGRHLTNDESIVLVRDQKERRERKQELEQRRVAQVDREGCKGCARGRMEGDCAKHT